MTISDKGRDVFASAAPIHTEFVKRSFIDPLTSEHLTNLTEAAEKVMADLPGDLCDD